MLKLRTKPTKKSCLGIVGVPARKEKYVDNLVGFLLQLEESADKPQLNVHFVGEYLRARGTKVGWWRLSQIIFTETANSEIAWSVDRDDHESLGILSAAEDYLEARDYHAMFDCQVVELSAIEAATAFRLGYLWYLPSAGDLRVRTAYLDWRQRHEPTCLLVDAMAAEPTPESGSLNDMVREIRSNLGNYLTNARDLDDMFHEYRKDAVDAAPSAVG